MKILDLSSLALTTPTTDPQDPGFDVFFNYICTRDPTASESTLPYLGYPWLPLWWQTAASVDDFSTFTTENFWLCVDGTADAMVWWKMVFDANILSVLDTQGWKLNTSRSYAPRSSPAFATSYTPSVTNDIQVLATLSLSSTLLTSAMIDIQIDNGTGFITIASGSLSGLAATDAKCFSFIVPANSTYKIISASGSSNSITSIYELTL